MTSLLDTNAQLHTRLSDALLAAIEALLALDMEVARRQWDLFCEAVEAHADVEDDEILPYGEGLDISPKGSATLIERDHRLIEKRLGGMEDVITELENTPAERRRRVLASNLRPIVQVQTVLSHHTERENDLFYPVLDKHLEPELKTKLASALDQAWPATD